MKSHSQPHSAHRSLHLHSHQPPPKDDFLETYRLSGPDRYSAKNMAKPVPFVCRAPHAREVFLAGDFNDWDEKAHPMRRQPDGAWRLEMLLNHGHHHYVFVADGTHMLDPRANGVGRNHRGEKVSVVAVS